MAKKPTKRSDELSRKEAIRVKFLDIVKDVEQGFTDQNSRADDILDHWDAYNCELNHKQFYEGTSQIFVPSITDCVNARKTRFTNQLFPQSQRNIEVVTEDADIPHSHIALAEHYVRVGKLRTQIVPALCVNGDVEGQYSLYVDWHTCKRRLTTRKMRPISNRDGADLGEIEDIVEEVIEDGGPDTEVISDNDLLILPVTANTVDKAIEVGGSVTVVRRWTKAKIKQLMKRGDIREDEGEFLLENMRQVESGTKKDTSKNQAQSAGIKKRGSFTLVYEIWTNLTIDKEERLCRGYVGGEHQVLSIKLCPYWCEKVPVISVPVDKTTNVSKGKAPIKRALDLQYLLNDTINEAADTSHYSAMPIVMTDPEKNPRVGSMVLGLAALWETSPKDTQLVQFPDLWRAGLERGEAIERRIQQSLSVTPAMMPQSTGKVGAKRNQAEVNLEQQVDLLTTADAVTNLEEGVLTPWVQRVMEYDAQFRDYTLTIRAYGPMGRRSQMEEIEPIQVNRKYELLWFGVEAAKNAAQIQQQIGLANVLKEVPPQLYPGYRLDLAPLIAQLVENGFGPRLAPLTFISLKEDLSVDPEEENLMLEHGFDLPTHPADNDQEHMRSHMADMQRTGDPHGTFRSHMMHHQAQLQTKAMAQAQMAQGAPPQQGGGGPQPGASPGQPHAAKQPPGAIHQDRMASAGAITGPRKT